MKDVGWDRLTRDLISQIFQLHTTDFDIKDITLCLAEVQASNLAQHIAIGPASDRLVILLGHDNNLASIAVLLNLSWMLPSFQLNDTPPGGAMVIEQRKPINVFRADDCLVRVYYVSQTLDEMREATRLHPPLASPSLFQAAAAATAATKFGSQCSRHWLSRPLRQGVIENCCILSSQTLNNKELNYERSRKRSFRTNNQGN